MSNIDPFDDILNLEDHYYDEGYQQGYADGLVAGKVEGRSVGLKQGFEKFLEAGRLQSRAIIWANRLPEEAPTPAAAQTELGQSPESSPNAENSQDEAGDKHLPLLAANARLEKSVTLMYALVEPGTLSTENTDEAVNDFDDRYKRAQGKLKIVERMVGETVESLKSPDAAKPLSSEV
jgi:hypothetical protein